MLYPFRQHIGPAFRRMGHWKILCIYVFLLVTQVVQAQQPAYFMLGDQYFKGIEIYDIIQDKKLNYWFSTSEGIYKYDYYTFQKIECAEAKIPAVFDFNINSQGVIYCFNLNQQIFEIKNDTCRLFYELKNDETSADLGLTITDEDEIVIASSKLLVLDKNANLIHKYTYGNYFISNGFLSNQNGIHYHFENSDTVVIYFRGKFQKKKLQYSISPDPNRLFAFYYEKENCYALNIKNSNLFSYNPATQELKWLKKIPLSIPYESLRQYKTGNELWVAGDFPGVCRINADSSAQNSRMLYEKYLISNVYKDAEGNYLLATFDNGILVVPDLQVPDVIHSPEDEQIYSLYSDPELGLMAGTSQGRMLGYSNFSEMQTPAAGKRSVPGIYGDTCSTLLIFDNGFIRAYDKQTGKTHDLFKGNLKDVAFVSGREFYLATNIAVVQCRVNAAGKITSQILPNQKSRTFHIEYNPVNKLLYISGLNGLYTRDSANALKNIRYENEDLYPLCIFYANGCIYVSTLKYGILIIEGHTVTGRIVPMAFGKYQPLNKIRIQENALIGKSAAGLFRFDLTGKLLQPFHTLFGFQNCRVHDFTFHQNKLVVSHAKGIQEIDLAYSPVLNSEPVLSIRQIFVNDALYAPGLQNTFSSDERKIKFVLNYPTLRNQESIRYHYRLLGLDSTWTIQPYALNTIAYSNLNPGTYTFEVKAENLGTYSAVQTFSFTVSKPYYMQPWFLALALAAFLFLVWLVYRWQLTLYQKKAHRINELNASKLTAIQSQMNPHFMFNTLNSLQDLILQQDTEKSSFYLGKFSTLMRMILENSSKDEISLADEIEVLSTYLQLEKLRFGDDFQYILEKDETVPGREMHIPTLVIQPFVENAIKHGLLHKKGVKELHIRFSYHRQLICVIRDNGIGRKKSKEINERQRKKYASFATRATEKRIELLRNYYKQHYSLSIRDLGTGEQPEGTEVTLRFPDV